MHEPVVVPEATSSGLESLPITPEWILDGAPVARARSVVMSPDKMWHVMAWDCTTGNFNWHFGEEDEIVYILGGEVFISSNGGPERRLAAGDVAVFPAGSSCTWRVTQPVRKIAVLRRRLPLPVALGVRAWGKFLRLTRHRNRAGGLSGV